MFISTGGGWLVLIITAMTQLPASSFIPSFVRLIIICLLLSSLLGCPGLVGLSQLDPGDPALQILQHAHNTTARKLSIDSSHQFNVGTFRKFITEPGHNNHHQVHRHRRGLPVRHHHHEEDERVQRPAGYQH